MSRVTDGNRHKTATMPQESATDLESRLAQALHELSEAREQQTATSEVLRVISSSPTDLAPVFDAILTNATRLCEGNFALLCRYDGGVLIGEATCNGTPEFSEKFMGSRITPGRQGPTRLAALERRTVHVADITVEPGFSPMVLQYERARTVLAVPLLRETNLVGVITIWRREVRSFTEQQIALVQTFDEWQSTQAVLLAALPRVTGGSAGTPPPSLLWKQRALPSLWINGVSAPTRRLRRDGPGLVTTGQGVPNHDHWPTRQVPPGSVPANTKRDKEAPGVPGLLVRNKGESLRDLKSLDAPILSHGTNQARRRSRKRPDPPV
jgi:GAF domain